LVTVFFNFELAQPFLPFKLAQYFPHHFARAGVTPAVNLLAHQNEINLIGRRLRKAKEQYDQNHVTVTMKPLQQFCILLKDIKGRRAFCHSPTLAPDQSAD